MATSRSTVQFRWDLNLALKPEGGGDIEALVWMGSYYRRTWGFNNRSFNQVPNLNDLANVFYHGLEKNDPFVTPPPADTQEKDDDNDNGDENILVNRHNQPPPIEEGLPSNTHLE
ncbi:hypothetical protein V6Z11_D05G412400 [Gossypium hirsutum]